MDTYLLSTRRSGLLTSLGGVVTESFGTCQAATDAGYRRLTLNCWPMAITPVSPSAKVRNVSV